MKPPALSLDDITALDAVYRFTVPPEYEDHNGHMNMRHYLAVFDDAWEPAKAAFGLTPAFLRANQGGGYDLEHHTHFLAEVMIGDEIVIYLRMVGRTAKRVHYMLFMVNQTRNTLASIFECVNAYADLSIRRTAPFPSHAAESMDAMLVRHQALDWDAPVSGVMGA